MSVAHDVRGFSLVEVLVAASLLATALVSLGHLLILSATAGRMARTQSVAVLLAAGKLEELRARVDTVPAVPEAGTERVDSTGTPFDDLAGARAVPTYLRQWSATPLPMDSALLRLDVTVMPWAGQGGNVAPQPGAAAVALSTIVALGVP
jgi:prepilin-type N-terminal cleavage/methylation domain-containing protein